jgi:hypothetical protein
MAVGPLHQPDTGEEESPGDRAKLARGLCCVLPFTPFAAEQTMPRPYVTLRDSLSSTRNV